MAKTDITPVNAVVDYLSGQANATQFCVAYSGGMDSHVLLHACVAALQGESRCELRAVHIDHGLHPESHLWAEHCHSVCEALNVPLCIINVDVVEDGSGLEAAARAARYSAFAEHIHPNEHLLLAQHADDQAETFLLQALRGSGPDGLASIAKKRKFKNSILARPLLSCSQGSLCDYAQEQHLEWVEDPSNQNLDFDRNFLRHEIMPLLQSRWPAAVKTLSRSAARSAAASQSLLSLAQQDFDIVKVPNSNELSVMGLLSLPNERAYNVLRLWVRLRGMRMPRLQDLAQVLSTLLQARSDANGVVNVRDYEFRRHRDNLYLLPPQQEVAAFSYTWSAPYAPLAIPEIDSTLNLEQCQEQGLALPENGTVTICSRQGGEAIMVGQPAFHKSVKKLLQESAVPPWQRDSIPLLYINEELAAVWGIVVAVNFRAVTELA